MPASLSTGYRCNNRCVFCAQADVPGRAHRGPDLDALSAAAADRDHPEEALWLTGGEPTLRDDLAAVVRAARDAGVSQVGVQTNGHALDAERVQALSRAGLSHVHVSVHGSTAAVHDYHTQVPGSFDALMNAMRACKTAGLAVGVTTVVTRSNFRVLSGLPDTLARLWVDAWCITIPHARGRAQADFDRVVPRLGLAMPFALHAVSRATALGLPAFVSGAPLCTLGPLATRSLPSEPRSYHDTCTGCPSADRCPGIDAHYAARFDGDELRHVDAPASDDRHVNLRSLFIGPGVMTPPTDVDVPAAPRAVRRSLPMLGKSQPGKAEVRRSDKQTGRALGSLFPALFEEDAS